MNRRLLPCIVLLALVACQREAEAPQATAPDKPAAESAKPEPAPVKLEDVIETTGDYIIGINYPPSMDRYPLLARELKRYADAARADVMRAVEAVQASGEEAVGPYDLSLNFIQLHASPQVVVVAADGSSYTGGAHGMPLVARFVWLPGEDTLLTTRDLLSGEGAWQVVSGHVREQLHGALAQRVEDGEFTSQERASLIDSGNDMIAKGTAPEPENFEIYVPVFTADGRINGLRFVFPPYQVGPYAEGTQTVEVPAAVLMPYIAPEYRGLFVGGQGASDQIMTGASAVPRTAS